MIELLAARGPLPEYADRLIVFGRLVGSWDIDARYFDRNGEVTRERRGEWHFGWVLEGRAIQDVIITPPLDEQRRTGAPVREYGTTLRAYDPRTDTWRVTYVAPVFGATVNLVAREAGNEIVLEGTGPDGKQLRWVFSDLTEETFRWRGYESDDGGRTWFMDEEMHLRRRAEWPGADRSVDPAALP